ncbi:MAG: DUF4493 domain-containing protein [Alistipes sp.]|nr:DUF4493 domain-containing protein [Alistipes sp.]
MRKILFAITLAVVATACHTNEGDNTAEIGSIAINAATRSEVTDSTEGRFILADAPAAENLKVEIVGDGKTQTWATLAEFNTANEGLRFISAPYAITLSYGEKGVEGWSKAYYEGSTSVEVPMYGLTAEAYIEVILQNSIVAIEATDNFKGYFPQRTFKVKNIEWDAAKEELLFLNAGNVKVTCEAVSQTGKASTFETVVTLKSTTRHTVLFDLSTAGNAKVDVTFDGQLVEVVEQEFELNENA